MKRNISFNIGGITAVMLLVFAVSAGAQTTTPTVEEFDLNIVYEKITEAPFERSKEISADAGDVRLRAGASVTASRVDIILRGITGHVTFRFRPIVSRRPAAATPEQR